MSALSAYVLQVFQEPALKRAKAAADKALNFQRRERMFIQKEKVAEMIAWTEGRDDELRRWALLFLFAYTFLLRVPSEALPAVVGGTGTEEGSNAVLVAGEGTLTLHLKRRKNKPEGSCLMRKCCCAKAPRIKAGAKSRGPPAGIHLGPLGLIPLGPAGPIHLVPLGPCWTHLVPGPCCVSVCVCAYVWHLKYVGVIKMCL